MSNTAAADTPITEEREVDDEGMKYEPHSLCLSFKWLIITLKTQLGF